ncbi:MAG: FAD-dependent monooxygenase [Pseudomonadota bacterium]|nr:FAD-dependent monooxygenase [Pseudomonadota bacterium]
MAVSSQTPSFDVAVVGAGLVGLAATLGFARAGFSVACIGRPERGGPGRTVALLGRTLDILENLDVLAAVEREAAPMRLLRIVDDTGSLFAARPVEFRAAEMGRDVFGWNIENSHLAALLAGALGETPRLAADVAAFDFAGEAARLDLSDGRSVSAKLVVGADGRGSAARKAAGIDMSERRFGQTALTLALRHERPHDDASTEFHTREGPFTLVPLPPTADAPHRSSLVWLMRDASAARRLALGEAELARELRVRAHAMLGEIEIEPGMGAFPMTIQRVASLTAPRLALAGDAAHAFPPIGAQGLNLGLRDVAGIVAAAGEARAEGADIGGAATLLRYAAQRRGDIALRTLGVGAFNASLLASSWPVDALRGLGLAALGAAAPLRRLAMREGLNPFLAR